MRAPPAGATPRWKRASPPATRPTAGSRSTARWRRANPTIITSAIWPGTGAPARSPGSLAPLGWGADLGYPALRWSADGAPVAAQMLASDELPAHWPRLDEFEGEQYLRILVPVRLAGGRVAVANLYALHPDAAE